MLYLNFWGSQHRTCLHPLLNWWILPRLLMHFALSLKKLYSLRLQYLPLTLLRNGTITLLGGYVLNLLLLKNLERLMGSRLLSYHSCVMLECFQVVVPDFLKFRLAIKKKKLTSMSFLTNWPMMLHWYIVRVLLNSTHFVSKNIDDSHVRLFLRVCLSFVDQCR